MSIRRKKSPPPGRQRAVPGTRSSQPAFSYYAQRAERPVEPTRQRGRSEAADTPSRKGPVASYIWQRAGLWILLIAASILLLSSLNLNTDPRLVTLSPRQDSYLLHSQTVYQQGVVSLLSGSIWNHTKLTIQTKSVSNQLQQKFPELSQVSITLPLLGHRPVIYLTFARPALILTSGNNGFVLDDTGKVLVPVSQLPADSHLTLPTVSNQTGLSPAVGKFALTSSEVQFVQAVLIELNRRQIGTTSVALTAGGDELDVYIKGQPYFVKFNTQMSVQDARQQAGTFIAVQNKLQSENITPSQYIDVRVEGRAYYK